MVISFMRKSDRKSMNDFINVKLISIKGKRKKRNNMINDTVAISDFCVKLISFRIVKRAQMTTIMSSPFLKKKCNHKNKAPAHTVVKNIN